MPIFVSGRISFHTPSGIRDAICAAAREEGLSAAVDVPFSGSLVPLSSYRKDPRILSVMIEVNRSLYMDERSGLKNQNFEQVSTAAGRFIMDAVEAAREYAQARQI